MEQGLIFDIGGTFIKYALMDQEAGILEQGKFPTPYEGREALARAVGDTASTFKGRYTFGAVSMPGKIDSKRGISVTAGALQEYLGNYPTQQLFEEVLEAPVTIANDGKCAAASEAWIGALSDVENGMVIVLGTGVGGGIVLGGQVYMGSHFSAGEFSMLVSDHDQMCNGYTFDPHSPMPFWVDDISAYRLVGRYCEEKGLSSEEAKKQSGVQFFSAVDRGETEACKVLEQFAGHMAVGIYSLQSVLDIERVAIGGGISGASALLPAVRRAAEEQFAKFPFFPALMPEIVSCRFGNDANLIGALKLALDMQRG